jgi:hypothetical protein
LPVVNDEPDKKAEKEEFNQCVGTEQKSRCAFIGQVK